MISAGSSDQGAATERRLRGLGVSPGIAIGPAYIGEGGDLPVRESHLPEGEIDAERSRFAEAIAVSLTPVAQTQDQSRGAARIRRPKRSATCSTRIWRCCRIRAWCAASTSASRAARINAERAVQLEIDEIAESFAAMHDAYLAARIEDIRVVGKRLIRNLIKKPFVALFGLGARVRSSSPRS